MNLSDVKLVLASKSPRRKQLLEQAGFSFEIRTLEVEEDYPETMPVEEVAPYLAQKKARESVSLLQSDEEILLTADSVVILHGDILEKPKDRADALQMLARLSGQQHTVITGVCLKSRSREMAFRGISQVYFEPLSQEEIAHYVDTYEPYDKAGSYAIQEWIGLCKIYRIEGTYANVMGLPMDLVYKRLIEFQNGN